MLYRHPGSEYVIRNNAGTKIGDGVDIRGAGGLVIMPPSRGKDGAYEQQVDALTVVLPTSWAKALCAPKARPISTPEPVIRDPRRARGYGTKVLREEAHKVAAAQPGGRNNTMTTCAFRVGTVADQCGITGEQAEEMFRWAASQWGDAGELRKSADTFRRAFEAGRNNPRNAEVRSA
jgi:hypothetical protein